MRNFTYTRAKTTQEALTFLSTQANAKFLGGGTNLVDLMRENIEQPDALIDVTRLRATGVRETEDGGVRVHADDRIPRAGHPDVGDIGGAFGQNDFIGCGNVRVRADNGGDPSVEIPAEGVLLGSRFGVEIDEDHLGFDLRQNLVGKAKGVVALTHENSSLQIDDSIGNAILLTFVNAPPGQAR